MYHTRESAMSTNYNFYPTKVIIQTFMEIYFPL